MMLTQGHSKIMRGRCCHLPKNDGQQEQAKRRMGRREREGLGISLKRSTSNRIAQRQGNAVV